MNCTSYARAGCEHTALLPKNEHATVEASFKAAVFGFSDGLTTSINLVLGVALTRQPHRTVVLLRLVTDKS